MDIDSSEVRARKRWWNHPLGIAITAGLVGGITAFAGTWFSVEQTNTNALEVVKREAGNALDLQKNQLEQSRQDVAFLAFIDATQALSRKVSERLGIADADSWNSWNQKYGPPSSIDGITPWVIPGGVAYSDYTGPAPQESELDLWRAVNESKNKLQLVCNADELPLINSLTKSLNVATTGVPEVAVSKGEKVSAPPQQLPGFQQAYTSASLSLMNAYRHDVLNLPPLPSVDPAAPPKQ